MTLLAGATAMGAAPAPRPPVALYVHVPFCLSVCPYCDFVVYGGRRARRETGAVERLVDALVVEIRLRAEVAQATFGVGRDPLGSVYFGGGTPSLLAPAEIGRLLDAVERRFGIAPKAEITLEANPAPTDRGDLRGFREAGVNRLSLGAQSLDAGELRRLGRRHRPTDVVAAVVAARAAGFENVSLDLLYDVPGQTLTSWGDSLAGTLDLAPEHVSAYALDLADPDDEGLTGPTGDHLPLRPGARRWRTRARARQDEGRAADQYELADALFSAAGFRHYELSNWARPGRESRHNLAYWTGVAWEAVGPGAHAYDGALTRRWNAAPLETYLQQLLAPVPSQPPGGTATIDATRLAAERAMLGLRLDRGIQADLARDPSVSPALAWGVANGLVESTELGGARLTARGSLLANEVFARLV